MNHTQMSSLRRQSAAMYQNPYNARKRVISKPLLFGTLISILLFWVALVFHVLHTTTTTTPTSKDTAKAGRPLPHKPIRRVPIPSPESDSKPTTTTVKKRKKDKTDYRSIKIETPPPKTKHKNFDFGAAVANLTAHNPVFIGRERLVRMLLEMWIDPTQIDDSIWSQVPVWKEIVKVHGSEPVVYGLDSCQTFRDTVPAVDRHVAIAGMFNTGTNLLAILLQHNCAIPEGIEKWGRLKGHGMEWQVPWGKHTPAWYRGQAQVKNFLGKIPPENIMVAVMLRHPHDWMTSMCRHGYTAKWNRNEKNCPNLYDGNIVDAKFGPGPSQHASLAHMWNDWNGAYYNATFPRVMVRFEDTIFFPKETSKKICTCVGGNLITPKEKDGVFHYVIDSAKTGPGHGPGQKRNGLIDAWIKYGKARTTSMRKSDLEFSAKHLDRDIVEAMKWKFPEIPDQ